MENLLLRGHRLGPARSRTWPRSPLAAWAGEKTFGEVTQQCEVQAPPRLSEVGDAVMGLASRATSRSGSGAESYRNADEVVGGTR